jgi:LmbE family N-acetylglucosaminyl deacetylase
MLTNDNGTHQDTSLPIASAGAITGGDNLLLLVPHPGDESLCCGGLIAELCQRGRPPFVMVLDDGSASPGSTQQAPEERARQHERETRTAVQLLGLPANRLLMVGLFEGTIPSDGPVFDAVVRAVALVMWARDCNIICAPAPDAPDPADVATHHIATEVATRTGVGQLHYTLPDWLPVSSPGPTPAGRRLDISAHLPRKHAAIATHTTRQSPPGWPQIRLAPYEVILLSAIARRESKN